MEEPSGPSQRDLVVSPLVFQCRECKSIIGDSFSFNCVEKKLRAVSLSALCEGVEVLEELEVSRTGEDLGSAYSPIICLKCKSFIGKMYKTTPTHLDHLRGNWVYDLDAITSYQLGRYLTEENKSDDALLTLPSIRELQESVKAIHNMVLFLNERINLMQMGSTSLKNDTAGIPQQSDRMGKEELLQKADIDFKRIQAT